jgi:hypothetical protein
MSYQRAERQKSMKNRPWQNKRTEKIANLGKVGDGITKIERSKTQKQERKSKQTRNKAQE